VSHQRDKDIRSAPNVPIAAAFLSSADRHSRFRLRPVPSLGGGVISNDARDYLKRDAAFRTTWDFGGGFGVFVETTIDDRSYHTPPADGISRSSAGSIAPASRLPRWATPSAARSAWAGTPARPRWRADRRQSRLARLGADHLPADRPVELYRLDRRRRQRRARTPVGI